MTLLHLPVRLTAGPSPTGRRTPRPLGLPGASLRPVCLSAPVSGTGGRPSAVTRDLSGLRGHLGGLSSGVRELSPVSAAGVGSDDVRVAISGVSVSV